MKKTAILLAIVMVLGISLVVYAGAQKVTFNPGLDHDGTSFGFVIINQTPSNADIEATIQVQVRDLTAQTNPATYEVYSGGTKLGEFTTNKKGHGHVHINLSSEGDLAAYISIWTEGKTSQILRASTPEEQEGTEEQEETQEQEQEGTEEQEQP